VGGVGGVGGGVTVEEITDVTDEVVHAMARLTHTVFIADTTVTERPSAEQLAEIAASPATILLAARSEPPGFSIVGLLTLAVFRIPTGVRAWIEDVVVDEAQRGRGVGEALTREALLRAEAAGARTVELTSRPTREAANRLYRRLGFVERETNVYRYDSR